MMTMKATSIKSVNVNRYCSIDIAKGIAMVMIILVHYAQNYQHSISRVFQYLQMGCPVFFVASGFGIMCHIKKRYNEEWSVDNTKKFYKSRFIALAPGWYVAFAMVFIVNTFVILIMGKPLIFGNNRSFISIICNLVFLHGLLPFCNNNVMPGGWYIGTTMILYLLTPMILRIMSKMRNRRYFFAVSSIVGMTLWIILYISIKESFTQNGFGYYFFLIHYPEYLLGVMLYYDYTEQLYENKESRFLILGIGSLILAIILYYISNQFLTILSAWMTALSAYCFLYFALTNEGKEDKRSSCKVSEICEKYGRNSYYIYLIHAFIVWPLASVLKKLLERVGISTYLCFILLIPIIIYLSYVAGKILKTLVIKITNVLHKSQI